MRKLKKLREFLPLIGKVYRKLSTAREALRAVHSALDASRHEILRQVQRYNELMRERGTLIQQRNDWILQRDQLVERLKRPSFDPTLLSQAQSESVRARFVEFLKLIQPADIADYSKIRVGGANDGGYVMVDDFAPSEAAISIGIGDNISWDTDMAARGLRVLQFDNSIEAPRGRNPQFSFYKRRIVGVPKLPDDMTLAGILELEQIGNDHNLIIKIDIEGDEWEVFDSVSNNILEHFRQIVVEFHWLQNFATTEWSDRAIAAIKKITHAHQIVHLHGNNFSGFAVLGGIPFPNVFEVTLIRKDKHIFSRTHRHWPTNLDAPNDNATPDLYIPCL